MYDTVLRNINISNQKYSNGLWFEEIVRENGHLENLTDNEYYLATIHRAENTDYQEKLTTIFNAFNELDKPCCYHSILEQRN